MSTPSPMPTPMPPASKPSRRSFKSWLLGSLVGAIVLIVLYTLFMLWWSYSEGERAGVLQKFSHKGWICKTWEGEIAMTTVPGVAPVMWNFTVRDDQVAKRMSSAVGQRVVLHYQEHRGVPTTCFGETAYFVDSVTIQP